MRMFTVHMEIRNSLLLIQGIEQPEQILPTAINYSLPRGYNAGVGQGKGHPQAAKVNMPQAAIACPSFARLYPEWVALYLPSRYSPDWMGG